MWTYPYHGVRIYRKHAQVRGGLVASCSTARHISVTCPAMYNRLHAGMCCPAATGACQQQTTSCHTSMPAGSIKA